MIPSLEDLLVERSPGACVSPLRCSIEEVIPIVGERPDADDTPRADLAEHRAQLQDLGEREIGKVLND